MPLPFTADEMERAWQLSGQVAIALENALAFQEVAATNRGLQEMVAKREYRADLYYRLNVFPIRVPPLRERREDIPPLVRYLVQRYAKRLKHPLDSVARGTLDALCQWHWPGNVRELQNVIERGVILSQGATLRVPLTEFDSASSPRTKRFSPSRTPSASTFCGHCTSAAG